MNNISYGTLVVLYIVFSMFMIFYTVNTINDTNTDKSYLERVHLHLTSVMFYHITLVSIFIYLHPPFFNEFHFSTLNLLLACMFSFLYYYTQENNFKLKHFYNAIYLIPVSVTMAELFLYFDNDECIPSALLCFVFFYLNHFFYSKNNRIKLFSSYVLISSICLISSLFFKSKTLFYALLFNIAYFLCVLAYIYKDHDLLIKKNEYDSLNDALKYFLSVEGLVIRSTT